MDDPWGSPWASAAATPKRDPDSSPPKSLLLSPPPKAFFGATLNIPAQSPWADDDGFGEWAGSEQPENTSTTSSSAWGPWSDSRVPQQQPTPKDESPDKEGPIAWPSSTATLRSRSSSVFRQHSPDPWAVEPAWNSTAESLAPASQAPHGDNEIIDIPGTLDGLVIQVDEPETTNDVRDDMPREVTEAPGPKADAAGASPIHPSIEEASAGSLTGAGAEVHGSPSRPSSTFSVDSEHEPDRQDSPITSIDEEPKQRHQLPPRRISGKVSELVGLYDGLAMSASEEPPEADREKVVRVKKQGRERSSSQSSGVGDDEDSNFDDFGDTASDSDRDLREASASIFSDRSSTPKAKGGDLPSKIDAGDVKDDSPLVRGPSVEVKELIEKFGALEFTVDCQVLDKLFRDIPEPVEIDSPVSSEVSDRIITDSFLTVEERKMWYRVSRYGSKRKHDSGDEENYHLVNWQTSQIHGDTIRIVRRWMEEDSFSGKATLGGLKRTSFFNWDSSAAPIELDKIFARKPSVTHSRTSSIAPPRHAQKPSVGSIGSVFGGHRISSESSSLRGPLSPNVASPVANFGWSSSAVEVPSTSRPSQTNIPGSKLPRVLKSDNAPQSTNSPVDALTEPYIPTAIQTQRAQDSRNEVQGSDAEDDWGEMVSPANDVPTGFGSFSGGGNVQVELPRSGTFPSEEAQPVFGWQETTTTTTTTTTTPAKVTTGSNDSAMLPEQPSSSPPGILLSAKESYSVAQPNNSEPHADLWAFADFSVFDTPPVTPRPAPVASIPPKTHPSTTAPALEMIPPQLATVATDTHVAAPNVILGPVQSSMSEQDQVRLVHQIVQCLPDMSYMLR